MPTGDNSKNGKHPHHYCRYCDKYSMLYDYEEKHHRCILCGRSRMTTQERHEWILNRATLIGKDWAWMGENAVTAKWRISKTVLYNNKEIMIARLEEIIRLLKNGTEKPKRISYPRPRHTSLVGVK